MPDEKQEPARDKALLVNLVMMLGSSAMQQLGKIVDPITNKAETDLAGAQITIDMLAMLQRKTRGNLDDAEQHILDSTLASLQMNYVETAAAEPEKPAPEAAPETAPPPEPGPPAAEQAERKDPKYRKSYG
ncbi:MAG: DUF1844 domain-containing protein [Lentisphaerae bacterium]|nr:DUF1844 domain-containing protein [Lentisphaerota bacterium]